MIDWKRCLKVILKNMFGTYLIIYENEFILFPFGFKYVSKNKLFWERVKRIGWLTKYFSNAPVTTILFIIGISYATKFNQIIWILCNDILLIDILCSICSFKTGNVWPRYYQHDNKKNTRFVTIFPQWGRTTKSITNK